MNPYLLKGQTSNNQERGWSYFLYVLSVLLLFYPYVVKDVYLPFMPTKMHFVALPLLILTFIFSQTNGAAARIKKVIVFPITQTFGLFVVGLIHGNILPSIGYTLEMLLAISLIYLIEKRIGLMNFVKMYNRWILLMAILGLITFFLVTFTAFQPISIVQDRIDNRNIYNYLFSFSKSDIIWTTFRYAGFFDEPGAMGYFGLYALLFNKLFIKDTRFETILIIALLFTFSLGYYAQLLLYLVLFYVVKMRTNSRLTIIVLVTAMIALAYYTKDTEYSSIYNNTIGRIEAIQGVSAQGVETDEYRYEVTNKAKRFYLESPLFGSAKADDTYVSDNIYEPLAKYGIIGSLFIYSPFILLLIWGISSKNKDLLKATAVMILGFWHRPFHPLLLYFFITYLFIVMASEYKRKGIY